MTYFGQVGKFFTGRAFDHAAAYRTEDYLAAALWLPPGISPDEEALGELMSTAVDPALQEEVFAVLEQVGAGHPEVPHWYLPVIGVDPTRQGQGYGSALLDHSLQAVDSAHDTAYLESTNPRNVSLYERFGFQVVGTIQTGSSPTITRMLRAPR
ncbi:MAG: N-acetyltransferase [Dehalococcoidia bacterium]|nr:N-acetyltransferase [Dehalococcoidia bacterium]